jgi:DNA-binding MarR family transcriptional regulator
MGRLIDSQALHKPRARSAAPAGRAHAPVVRARAAAPATETGSESSGLPKLFSYRIHLLANLSTRGAGALYARKFGLTIGEWRAIGVLEAHGSTSLKELASAINFDKSQASRVVSSLLERQLIRRDADEADGRGVRLSLTRAGHAMFGKVFPEAQARNEHLLAALTAEERKVLDRALVKLTRVARALLAAERRHGAPPAASRKSARGAKGEGQE